MKNRLYLAVGVLVFAAVGGLLWLSPWEPAYDGKLATPELIRALREDNDPIIRGYSAEALGLIGKVDSNVVAALTEALKDRNINVRHLATNALQRLDPEAAAKAGVKKPSP
jgi:HEAT repeat protein